MRRLVPILLGGMLALGWATHAMAIKLVFRPKLQRHKGTQDLLVLVKLENAKDEENVTRVSLESASLKIKDVVHEPATPLPLVVGAIEAGKSAAFSLRFDHDVAKKGDAGLLTLKATAGKEIISGTYRVTIP